jgi:hypothetical protein
VSVQLYTVSQFSLCGFEPENWVTAVISSMRGDPAPTVHVVFLLAQEFHLGMLARRSMQGGSGSDGPYRALALAMWVYSWLGYFPSRMIQYGVNILIAFPFRKYRAVDRSADPKGELQLTVL